MKVFIHIYDECGGASWNESPYVEKEFDFAPVVGDCLMISPEEEKQLIAGMTELYRKKGYPMYKQALFGEAYDLIKEGKWNAITPDIFRDSLNLADYMYVVERIIVAGKIYNECPEGLHIFIYCDEDISN